MKCDEMKGQVPLQEVMDMVYEAIAPAVVERGRKRQAAVWCGERPDYLPLLLGHTEVCVPGLPHDRTWKLAEHGLMGGAQVSEFFDYPHYSLVEQFDSPEKMLYEFLWEILSWARSKSDAQLAIRVYILNVLPAAFGARLALNETYGLYVAERPTKEQLRDLDPARLGESELFKKLLDYIACFRENAPTALPVYPTDTGGPLTTAQALRGDALYLDFYDDPDFVHELLDRTADICIQAAWLLKEAVGEEVAVGAPGYHGALYMARGAVRVVDDSMVMISPRFHQEFVLPPVRKVFQAFGGGWYHSCGVYPDKLDGILSVPEITTVNLNDAPIWPDLEKAVRKIVDAGKVFYGPWPVRSGETLEEAFRRALDITEGERKGLILKLRGEGPWPPPEEIMDRWHKTQDEYTV